MSAPSLRDKIQALHDEVAADARGYFSYFESDSFTSGRIDGRREAAEEMRDRLADILKETQ